MVSSKTRKPRNGRPLAPHVRKVLKTVHMPCAYFGLADEFYSQSTRAGSFLSLVLLFDYSGAMSLGLNYS